MKRTYFILLILVVIAKEGFSQEKKWTLDECMRYAVENSPSKNKQSAQNSIYHQNYLEAIGKVIPSVNAATNANFNFGRALNEDNTYSDVNSFSNNYELSSSLVLFDGLANINRIKMEKMNRLMGKERLQEVKDIVAYDTMEAFFNVLYYKQMVRLAHQQLEQSSNDLKQVKRMEELGVKSFPDVAEMQAKEAKDTYNLTRQKNLQIIAVIKLKEKMNYPIDEGLAIDDYMSETLIAKTAESALDIYNQSVSFLPKALAAEASYNAYKLAYRTAKGSLFPTISVGGGISTGFYRLMDGSDYSPFDNQWKDKMGHYVGFTLRIPIFNGFSKSAQVKRSKAQMIIAENEKNEMLRILYSEIEQAVADMNGQADEYHQAQKQVDAMKVAHDVNERKYKEGLISALELHTSANRLFESRVEELNTQLKYYLKNRLVNYYKGESFIK
ncbi:MAG: TolC family protein [Dysgonomonas sp.]|nr:TolC family protein [Dysgonomonas sp.]